MGRLRIDAEKPEKKVPEIGTHRQKIMRTQSRAVSIKCRRGNRSEKILREWIRSDGEWKNLAVSIS